MQYVQIPGTTFVRDVNSMGLVNKDLSSLEEYKMKRRMLATQKEEINTIKSEIESIKNDMTEIKQLMLKLLDKGSNG
jgi:chromosome segregation ATPase